MKPFHLLFAAFLALAPAAFATTHQGSAVVADAALTEAEVQKVDREARKITLRHKEIRNLEMPPMTMRFVVKEDAMLDRVKQGDKVRFAADKVDGTYYITRIEPAK